MIPSTFCYKFIMAVMLEVVIQMLNYRSEEHTSELRSHHDLVCRLLLEKKKYFFIRHIDSQNPCSLIKYQLNCMPVHCMNYHLSLLLSIFFFFNDTATTEIYTLSLHDALPIYHQGNLIPQSLSTNLKPDDFER